MNILIQVFSVFLIALGTFILLVKLKDKFEIQKLLKIVSLVLALIFVVRYMLDNEAIRYTLGLENEQINNKILSLISILLTWFNLCVNLVIILYPFFKLKAQTNLIKLFCLPMSMLTFAFLSPYTKGIIGVDAYRVFDIRIILLSLEVSITFGYSLFVFFTNYKRFTKSEILNVLVIIPVLLLAVMPAYTLQGIFGYANTLVRIKDLSYLHRYVIYLSVILPIIIYAVLKGKPKDVVYYTLLFISLGTLISFSADFRFERFLRPTAWPLHLCNTAMYIIPLCMIFKMKRLFYFTYFINVLGAFFAMAMPNYSTEINVFATNILIFYINHYIAFFMPLLLVELDVFERPKLKQFKYSMVAFFVYFVLMLVINAWFSNYNANVDFFFLNSDFIAEKLGTWALNLRNITWEFNISDLKFVFYPVYQILFFVTYILFGLGMWFIYELMYSVADHFVDMRERRAKIKLHEYALKSNLGENYMQEPIFKEGMDKLIIKDFKKKYGQSNVYAVNGINLTINSGEIFGFLGPNGAGKSSTIKCLVGIQGLSEGQMLVNGYDVENQSVEAKKQIGFVPDHYALYEKLTGREYVNYIADIYGVSQEQRKTTIDRYVKLFELENSFDNPIRTYSHGMKQKITIIQALCHNPKVWILDEPLTGLDPNSIFQVKECMKEHARKGNIVFFSSHIIDVVEKLCDKIAIIKKGEIVAVSSVEDITKSGVTLEEYYLQNINGTTDLLSLKKDECE